VERVDGWRRPARASRWRWPWSNSDAKLYALTAGHCVRDFPGATWFANFPNGEGHAIGLGHSANPPGDATTDAGIIAINDPSATGWAPRAEVLVLASDANGGPGTTYDETYAIAGTGTSSFGMRVCKAGAAFGTSCGIVFALNVTGPTGVTGMAEANYHGGHGDSGAPVFAGHIAYGLHQSHDPTSTADSWDSFYVGITHATGALKVHVAVGN
jgi:hypothetical protein